MRVVEYWGNSCRAVTLGDILIMAGVYLGSIWFLALCSTEPKECGKVIALAQAILIISLAVSCLAVLP